MSLLVVGSVAFDSIETPFGQVEDALGGSAMFFSASSSFQSEVSLVAVVGEDYDLSQLDFLKSRGVSLSGLKQIPGGQTFRWQGKYGYDLNQAHTLGTQLNVFEGFKPELSETQRNLPFVFLANIMPQLQLEVLDQVESPRFIAADTMNLWIDTELDALKAVLGRVDMLVINEAEARQLAQQSSVVKAAEVIRALGPKTIVIKQGEYGSLLFYEDSVFSAPAVPLETVFDPTGAGDSFAGGLMGCIARSGEVTEAVLRRGVVLGTVMASFCVEQFGPERLKNLSWDAIRERYREVYHLTRFDDIEI